MLTHRINVARHVSEVLLLAILFSVNQSCCAEAGTATPKGKSTDTWSVHFQPSRLVNGSPVVFQVTPPSKVESLSGTWLGHEVFFAFDSHSNAWVGIAGVSLETQPGKYPLDLESRLSNDKSLAFQFEVAVHKEKYGSVAVSVPKQYTQPNPEQLREIETDKKLKEEVFGRVSPDRGWAGTFVPPVKAQVSDVFGTTRTFNGRVQNVHKGLDYAVGQGTAVSAVNSGVVVLAQPLFFEGSCIILDHGQGLLSIYMHLSKIEVKEGDHIVRGQEIALSGGTGLATGPHLHVAVRWQGLYLNPATLLMLKLS